MNSTLKLLAVSSLVTLLACGGDPVPEAGNSDALEVNAALGLKVVDSPAVNDSSFVLVKKGGDAVNDAVVKLGGVTIPRAPGIDGAYDLSLAGAQLAQVFKAGATVALTAQKGSETASVTFTCPAEVQLTSPVEGQAVAEGESVSLTWSRAISAPFPFTGIAQISGYDPADNRIANPHFQEPFQRKLANGATSADVTVPSDSAKGYIAELIVPGEQTSDDAHHGVAWCVLVRRAHLTVP